MTAFANAAIGKLYGKFPEEEVQAHLDFEKIEGSGGRIIQRSIDNAKLYYAKQKQSPVDLNDDGEDDYE
jgi:hypothetical protein